MSIIAHLAPNMHTMPDHQIVFAFMLAVHTTLLNGFLQD